MNRIIEAIYYGCIEEIGASNEHGKDVRKAESNETPEFYGVYLKWQDGAVALNDWIHDFMSEDQAGELTKQINSVIKKAQVTTDLQLRTENLLHALKNLDNAALKLADEIMDMHKREENLMNLHNAHWRAKFLMDAIKEDSKQ